MKIKVHPSFGIYLLFIAILSSLSMCLCVVASLLIHELSHYAACKVIGEEIDQLEITPLGGIMTRKRGVTSSKGLKGVYIHAAGPLGNYAAILLSSMALTYGIGEAGLFQSMLITNTSMMLINLLPALPLDGGQILFCLGYYFFPVAKLVYCLSALGFLLGIGGILLSIYGLAFRGLLNCSLMIISIHMIISSMKCHRTLIAENIYTVMHERISKVSTTRKVVFYQVTPDKPLIELIAYLKQNRSIFFIFTEAESTHVLHEHAFCQTLLTMPCATIRQAYQNTLQSHEKVQKNRENPRFTP